MIQRRKSRSSRKPRIAVSSRCVCTLTRPGRSRTSPKSCSSPGGPSPGGPTNAMRSPSTATTPLRTGSETMGTTQRARYLITRERYEFPGGPPYVCRMPKPGLLDELKWRGLLYQHTDGIGDALASDSVAGYIGFDPTAPSLHIGTLLVIMLLVRLQEYGH